MDISSEERCKLIKVSELLKSCESILFITGAGISAKSGLPTYRGAGGLYNDKVTEDGIPIEMALAGETFRTQPAITWKYLSQIEKKCQGAKFNAAHKIITEMESHFQRVWVLTQNIDGLHHSAGSKKIIDIHGDMHKLLCTQCDWRKRVEDYSQISIPPICPKCNAIVRPDVVFFGETLPKQKVEILAEELEKKFDMYCSIGTTSVFPYIQQPILDAKLLGHITIEINPDKTEISDLVDIKIPLEAAEALHIIWEGFNSY